MNIKSGIKILSCLMTISVLCYSLVMIDHSHVVYYLPFIAMSAVFIFKFYKKRNWARKTIIICSLGWFFLNLMLRKSNV